MRINEIHGKDMYKKRNIKEYNFDSFQNNPGQNHL